MTITLEVLAASRALANFLVQSVGVPSRDELFLNGVFDYYLPKSLVPLMKKYVDGKDHEEHFIERITNMLASYIEFNVAKVSDDEKSAVKWMVRAST